MNQAIQRINELEYGKGKDVTVKEVFEIAERLDVHPFALLWPGRVNKKKLETVSNFFKGLTIAKMKN
jgi:hypothetical protein